MDPIDITYNDEVGFLDDKKRDWQDWIMKLLLLAKKEIGKDNNLEMSINFVDEDRSHEINLKYRDKDRPTDVISFAIEDGEDSIDLAAFEDDPDFQEDSQCHQGHSSDNTSCTHSARSFPGGLW